ncbi:hypothetical protein CXB77_09550 [Chromatium okenii]|uniref:Uncharacterized protein n=1 Tax=Chromatium okenii TaxID=61644 RepID=A0A2S7XQT1_9GAMM|nr:hypothetical protein CXB77_09550 [Chromatium okenii]
MNWLLAAGGNSVVIVAVFKKIIIYRQNFSIIGFGLDAEHDQSAIAVSRHSLFFQGDDAHHHR